METGKRYARTFAVYGSQSPIFTGTYGLSNLSRTVTLNPARAFSSGEQALSSAVRQFWAGVEGGNGHFCTNGHDVGPGDDNTWSLALGDSPLFPLPRWGRPRRDQWRGYIAASLESRSLECWSAMVDGSHEPCYTLTLTCHAREIVRRL